MEIDPDELARLREIEALVRELFELEHDVGGLRARSVSDDDERDEAEIEQQLKQLVDVPPSMEPELQHQRRCPHPQEPCTCRRSHLLAEAQRLRNLILAGAGRG
jgi:hypothetical protein